jgi:hypothetical protein
MERGSPPVRGGRTKLARGEEEPPAAEQVPEEAESPDEVELVREGEEPEMVEAAELVTCCKMLTCFGHSRRLQLVGWLDTWEVICENDGNRTLNVISKSVCFVVVPVTRHLDERERIRDVNDG